jgi:hypothetical protein
VELYFHSPPSWRGAQLKYRDNLTFTFLRGRKWQEAGEDCIMKIFITYMLHKMIKSRRMR